MERDEAGTRISGMTRSKDLPADGALESRSINISAMAL